MVKGCEANETQIYIFFEDLMPDVWHHLQPQPHLILIIFSQSFFLFSFAHHFCLVHSDAYNKEESNQFYSLLFFLPLTPPHNSDGFKLFCLNWIQLAKRFSSKCLSNINSSSQEGWSEDLSAKRDILFVILCLRLANLSSATIDSGLLLPGSEGRLDKAKKVKKG